MALKMLLQVVSLCRKLPECALIKNARADGRRLDPIEKNCKDF